MPLYFFDFSDSCEASFTDAIGTDLPGKDAIPDEAVAALVSNARDRLPDGAQRVFGASVRDEQGRVWYTATLTLQSRWE